MQHKRVGVDPRVMGMPQAMSNYGPPLNYFPTHLPPPQHTIYPPQYHGRIPPMREPDMYQDNPYDPYLRERDARYGEYHYPPQEQQRYPPRVPSYFPEEVRYSQPFPRDQIFAPPGRQTQQDSGLSLLILIVLILEQNIFLNILITELNLNSIPQCDFIEEKCKTTTNALQDTFAISVTCTGTILGVSVI